MLCINVYLHSKENERKISDLSWDKLSALLKRLVVQFPKAQVVLEGDVNAGIGSGNRYLAEGGVMNEGYIIEERLLQDSIVNKAGRKFLELLTMINFQLISLLSIVNI